MCPGSPSSMSTEVDSASSWRLRVRVGVDETAGAVELDLARQVADELGLAFAPLAMSMSAVHATQFCLRYQDAGWALWPPTVDEVFGRQPLRIDFVADPRFIQPMSLREPLAKAIGLRANRRPTVFDLTAGLGRDAWALASTGCRVVAFERHPLVAFLLADGLRRAAQDATAALTARRITLISADPRTIDFDVTTAEVGCADRAEAVWLLDPMFPERRKTALVKKPMRIFQALVGADEDAAQLFAWARRQPGGRWVVKRPPQAPRIDDGTPSMNIVSGRIRFDCYLG